MTPVKLKNALKASPSGRLLGLLFFFLFQISFAQSNDNKQVYDLNDPHNPNCPCHKVQKMADDEFKKLPKEKELNRSEENIEIKKEQILVVSTIQPKELGSRLESGHSDYSKKQKLKKLTPRIYKHFNLFRLKHPKTKKIKPCYSVCFKW